MSRLDHRQFYSCVASIKLNKSLDHTTESISELDILNYGTKSEGLKIEDIVLRKVNINMGMKDKHPLEEVRFFKTDTEGNYELIKKE